MEEERHHTINGQGGGRKRISDSGKGLRMKTAMKQIALNCGVISERSHLRQRKSQQLLSSQHPYDFPTKNPAEQGGNESLLQLQDGRTSWLLDIHYLCVHAQLLHQTTPVFG